MKRIIIGIAVLAAAVLATFYLTRSAGRKAVRQVTAQAEEKEIYVCPMHPMVTSDKPGNCSICGMDLVKRSSSEELTLTAQEELVAHEVRLSPTQQVLANVATEAVAVRLLAKEITTVGTIDYVEGNIANLSARVAGRTDSLFVNYTGERVTRGQPLLSMYSPDIVGAEQEYLLALDSNNPALLESARRKLILWGITAEQIDRLGQSREMRDHLTIFSPISGTVIDKLVHLDMYVAAGQPLYNIADLSTVWMWAEIYEYEFANVRVGQSVEVTAVAYPGEKFYGTINFVSPVVDTLTRTVRIRAEFDNPSDRLKPGMYVDARIKVNLGRKLAIPASAVLNTGQRQVAWVEKEPGVYTPRDVQIGQRAGNYCEVLSGVAAGEKVVTQAGFLIDSESQLARLSGAHAGHDTTSGKKQKEAMPGMPGM